MSSSDSSPVKSRFSGSDIDFFSNQFDPTFTADISNKMQVPKKLVVVGGHEVEGGNHHHHGHHHHGLDMSGGGNDNVNGNWRRRDGDENKVAMQVPERIIVTGQESHRGAKALPRELQLETVVMPPAPEMIRIQTPPRSITLQNGPLHQHSSNEHRRGDSESSYKSEDDEETLIVENDSARFGHGGGGANNKNNMSTGGAVMGYNYGVGMGISSGAGGDDSLSVSRRGQRSVSKVYSGGAGAGELDENDEIDHLREQLSRMNRRLLAVEEDTAERKERERYVLLAGLFYVAYKTCAWLFKTPHY